MKTEKMKVVCQKCGSEVDLSHAVQDELLREIQTQIRKDIDSEKEREFSELQSQLDEKSNRLKEALKNELELRKQKQALDEKEENLDLEIARRVDDERQQIAKNAREKSEEESRLKIKEYESQLSSVRDELDAVKRRAEQNSQQLQGESAELDLEQLIRQTFPYDEIAPVEKGIRGADILQRVQTKNGQFCGTIVWESKNTKNWSDRWISKLKEDQLRAKADMAMLVSAVLPEDVIHFSCVDNVWITGFPYAIGLATALREHLVQVAHARRSLEGKDEKIEFLYNYLSGPEFRQRIEMIVKTFDVMKSDLESEKRAMNKIWNQRDKSIEKVIMNVSGMYGDLQGIIGTALPSIQALELPDHTD